MTDNDMLTRLDAHLDADERTALAAPAGPWTYQDVESIDGGHVCEPTVAIAPVHHDEPGTVDPQTHRTVPAEEADALGWHIVANDQPAVLARIAAHRAAIDAYRQVAVDLEQATTHLAAHLNKPVHGDPEYAAQAHRHRAAHAQEAAGRVEGLQLAVWAIAASYTGRPPCPS